MSPTNVHTATLLSLEYSRKVNESAVMMVRRSLAYDRRNNVERTGTELWPKILTAREE